MKPKPTVDPFDYDDYSLQELQDARLHIDVSRHPDRARELDERIAARDKELEAHPELAAKRRAPLWPLAVVGVLIVAIAGIVAAVKIPKAIAEGKRLAVVVEALQTAYPESVPVEATVVAGGGRPGGGPRAKGKAKGRPAAGPEAVLQVELVAPDRVDQPFEARRDHAREVAAAAFAAFDPPDRLTSIAVHFLKEAGSEAGPGARFTFPADEFREPEASTDSDEPDAPGDSEPDSGE